METTLEPQKLIAPEDPVAELKKLNPSYMKIVEVAQNHDKIVLLRAYDVRTPYEEMCIQLILDKIEPVGLSGTEEEKIRREMSEEAARGIEIDSPEQEQYWETKLQDARGKDAERAQTERNNREATFRAEKLTPSGKVPSLKPSNTPEGDPNSLQAVVGLGVKSIAKLEAAGIKNKKEFNALSYEQKKSIVGPLVAEKFK